MQKNVVITKKQYREINENTVTINVPVADNNIGSYKAALSSLDTRSDISKAGATGDDVNVVMSSPDSNDNQPVQSVNVNRGQNPSDALDSVNTSLLNRGGKVIVTGDGLGESRLLKKKQIEEMRLKNMLHCCVVKTKKEIQEEINK